VLAVLRSAPVGEGQHCLTQGLLRVCVCVPCRDTLLHGQPMRRPSIKAMDIPHGMRMVVEQECNSSQVGAWA
jgi:hypothetical protein